MAWHCLRAKAYPECIYLILDSPFTSSSTCCSRTCLFFHIGRVLILFFSKLCSLASSSAVSPNCTASTEKKETRNRGLLDCHFYHESSRVNAMLNGPIECSCDPDLRYPHGAILCIYANGMTNVVCLQNVLSPILPTLPQPSLRIITETLAKQQSL